MNDGKTPESINLKALEGALCCTFTPPLTAAQNAALLHDTMQSGSVRMASLAEFVSLLARSWGRDVLLDPCEPYPPVKAQN